MRRIALALIALLLLRGDMFQDASNAKLPEARTNIFPNPTVGQCLVGTGTDWVSQPCAAPEAGGGMATNAANAVLPAARTNILPTPTLGLCLVGTGTDWTPQNCDAGTGDMSPNASNAVLPAARTNILPTPTVGQCLVGTGTDWVSQVCPGGDASTRTLASFGAVCNGTADDTAAFTAATAWIAGGNARIVSLPAGTCVTSQAVKLGNGRQRSTTLALAASTGATSLTLTTTTGILAGDGIMVQLTSGQHQAVVSTVSGGTVTITPGITGAAASGLRVYTGIQSTYHNGGYVGRGGCATNADATGTTIKYTGTAAPTTTLAAPAARGATSITVASVAGFGPDGGIGVPIGITLDTGEVWWTHTEETPTAGVVKMVDEMQGAAAAGKAVLIANNPVVRVAGPITGATVEGVCLEANSLAGIGMDASTVASGKFRGSRGVGARNYTGVGFWLHTVKAGVTTSGGYTDSEHELYTETTPFNDTIGVWTAGSSDTQTNSFTRAGFSRNRFYGGSFRMGGASIYAAGLRLQHIDNNTFERTYIFCGACPGLGAGIWRQPSWQRNSMPQENFFIGPAITAGGVTNGMTVVDSAYIGVDHMVGYSVSDGAPLPRYAVAGSANNGSAFGMLRPTFETSTQFTLPGNLTRSLNIVGRYGFMVESVSGGNVTIDVLDLNEPEAPTLVSQTTIGVGNALGRAAYGSGYLYVPVNDNANSIYVVDMSDIRTPVLVATIAMANSGAGAVALSGSMLVAGTRTGGVVRTYDVSNPRSPRQLATMTLPNVARTTSIALRGRFAYLSQATTTGKGLEVLDLIDPAAPTSVGSYNAGADVLGLAVAGRYAYLAKVGSVLDVVDIADPVAMTSVGTAQMKNLSTTFAGPLPIIGSYLFWPGSLAINSTQIADISVPTAPTYLDHFGGVNTTSIDYGLIGPNIISIQSGSTANFRVSRLYSHVIPAGQFGALTTDHLRVRDGAAAVFDGELVANRGINVGLAGIASRGPLSGSGLSLTSAAAVGKLAIVCGTTAGTAKLVAYAGTSATPVTVLDNIGAGVSGC